MSEISWSQQYYVSYQNLYLRLRHSARPYPIIPCRYFVHFPTLLEIAGWSCYCGIFAIYGVLSVLQERHPFGPVVRNQFLLKFLTPCMAAKNSRNAGKKHQVVIVFQGVSMGCALYFVWDGLVVRPAGLVVWFSLRVREVTGSIPV